MDKFITIFILLLLSKCQAESVYFDNGPEDFETICTNEKIPSSVTDEGISYQMKNPVNPFIGRKAEINNLKNEFESGKKSVVISGARGIGKSELARKYAVNLKEDDQKASTIWIDASSLDLLLFSFQELATFIGINTKDKVPSEIIREIFSHFKDKKALFIFDNASNDIFVLNNLNKFMTANSENYILITSRDQKWNSNFKIIHLGVFSKEDTSNFFISNLNLSSDNITDAINLGELLKNIPLALSKAAKYIKDKGDDYTLKDFIDDYSVINTEAVNRGIEDMIMKETIQQEEGKQKLNKDTKDIYEELGLRPTKTVYVQQVRPPTGTEIKDAVVRNVQKEASRVGHRIEKEARRAAVRVNKFFNRLKNDVAG